MAAHRRAVRQTRSGCKEGYNRAHGTVVVDCAVSAAERIRIGFTDTGAGLAPDKLAQLFQPFNRLESARGKGTTVRVEIPFIVKEIPV